MMVIVRVALAILLVIFLFGCAGSASIVEEPPPEVEAVERDFVTGPLPGIDSLVINDVLETFDSTFVDADAEGQAREKFLEGQRLVAHAESVLTVIAGPSVLENASSTEVDTVAFTNAMQGARDALTQASRAQAAQDSVRAQSLLATAQERLEEAVSLHPRHEEAQYQLAQVYAIRANYFRQQVAWEQSLDILRRLVALRANEHALWAEISLTLDNLEQFSHAAVMWLRAAETVLDDARLSFDDAPVDTGLVFTYSVRAYRSFVNSRNGEGVERALTQALQYTSSTEEYDFVKQEMIWSQWDYLNLDHRIVFDSLRQAASEAPLSTLTGFDELIPMLTRPAAIWEASYNHAILSYDNGFQNRALDTLRILWSRVTNVDSSENLTHILHSDGELLMGAFPYITFQEDIRSAYGSVLFERALSHVQDGNSGLAFTYFMQVAEIESEYIGKAYIEAIKLARYNPEQALKIEPRVEEIFDEMEREDQLAYLREIGNLYRRLGENEKTNTLLMRFRNIRNQISN